MHAQACSATPPGTPHATTPAEHYRCRTTPRCSSRSWPTTSTTPTSAPARHSPPQHAIHDLAARGELPVERLDALPEPASLTALRARVDSLMPPADLPDLVLEIAAKTEFLDAFTNDHEPNAQLHDLQISLCAVLAAQA